jgi:hypothetical protein
VGTCVPGGGAGDGTCVGVGVGSAGDKQEAKQSSFVCPCVASPMQDPVFGSQRNVRDWQLLLHSARFEVAELLGAT